MTLLMLNQIVFISICKVEWLLLEVLENVSKMLSHDRGAREDGPIARE